jgi:ATP adenylyltransferase
LSGWPRWLSILWAPWRLAYIRDASRRDTCVFCEAPRMGDDEALIVYRGRRAYIILNRFPYNSGHLMIAPYRHVASLEDLSFEELVDVMVLVKISLKALREAYSPHGFNIGVNVGEAAGAGVAGHVHVHVVPRWVGDTNYMTVTGGVKVIPQLLEDTLKTLKPLVERIAKEHEGELFEH